MNYMHSLAMWYGTLSPCAHALVTCAVMQVAFMKMQGMFDKQHHKHRDEFSSYVEAAARAHHQLGSRPSAVAGGKN